MTCLRGLASATSAVVRSTAAAWLDPHPIFLLAALDGDLCEMAGRIAAAHLAGDAIDRLARRTVASPTPICLAMARLDALAHSGLSVSLAIDHVALRRGQMPPLEVAAHHIGERLCFAAGEVDLLEHRLDPGELARLDSGCARR